MSRIDIEAQPHYPFEFHQGDALTALDELTCTGTAGLDRNILLMSPPHQRHKRVITAGHMLKDRGRVSSWERAIRLPDAMGCPWMTQKEVSQAIPPAYTEWIGRQLLAHLEMAA